MRRNIENNENEEGGGAFLLVPRKWLENISQAQDRILSILTGGDVKATIIKKTKADLGDYISEIDARELLGRKSGWFWKLRQTGQLPYLKSGRAVYYKRADIIHLLDQDYEQRNG